MKNSEKSTEERIRRIIERKKGMVKLTLKFCVHCSICSESCFLYESSRHDSTFTPSYKAINSIGRLYKKKGRISDKEYDEIKELIWEKCVLCTRCYCPVGIDIPSLIACARSICREKGVFRTYDNGRSQEK